MENGVFFEKAKLAASYRTLCFDNKKVKFIHFFNDFSPLTVEFIFTDSEKLEQGKMNARFIENGYFQIELPNKFNSLGICNTETMEIGSFQNKKIYVNFAIFCVTQSKPIIDLAIYVEDETYGK